VTSARYWVLRQQRQPVGEHAGAAVDKEMARIDEEGDGRARQDLSPARPGAGQISASQMIRASQIRASQIRPSLLAAYTASARRRAPSFCITLPTWNFTVAAEM